MIQVIVNNDVHKQFTSLRIGISMGNIANTFSFSLPFMVGKDLRTGMPVRITMNGGNILVGYINAINRSLRGDNAMVEVSGRSKAGDLVNCQVDYSQTDNISFEKLAEDLCKPFGIKVKYDMTKKEKDKIKKIPKITVDHEEPYAVLAKHAASRGLVLMSDGGGRLVVSMAKRDDNPFVIEQGSGDLRILSVQHAQTTEEFSTYTGVQTGTFLFAKNALTKTFNNPNTNPLAIDTPIRHRPCVFSVSTKVQDKDQVKKLAEFQYYRVNPNTLVIQVQGWGYIDEEGNLCPWAINMVHKVIIEELDIVDVAGSTKNRFLIETVEFNLSNDGRTTTLTLCSPMKYNQEGKGK